MRRREPLQPRFASLQHDGFVLEVGSRVREAAAASVLALFGGAFSLIGLFQTRGSGEVVAVSLLLAIFFAGIALQAYRTRKLRVTAEEIVIEDGVPGWRSVRRFKLAEVQVRSELRRDNAGTTIRELQIVPDEGAPVLFKLPLIRPGEREEAAAELQWCEDALEAARARARGSTEAEERVMEAALRQVQRRGE